ncbi:unnamed protein product [Sympodiomycopsis kandeliae]
MSADPRYYQLWAGRPSTSQLADANKNYRVDLDAPGGVTYAPSSETSSNSAKRRLFLPRRGAADEEYDYGYDVAQARQREREKRDKDQFEEDTKVRAALASSSAVQVTPRETPFAIGEEDEDQPEQKDNLPPSEAQLYAQSISMTPAEVKAKQVRLDSDKGSKDSSDDTRQAPSIKAQSIAPSYAHSAMSTMTASQLASKRGLFQTPSMLRKDAAVVSTFRPAPSISGETSKSKTPWTATEYTSRREFDKMTEEERERGLTRFEEYSGEGNVPSVEEVRQNAERDANSGASIYGGTEGNYNDDGATIRTARTSKAGSRSLQVSDLFIPDPRPYRPLRLVRRSDPSQALVLCSGVVMTPSEAKAFKATETAVNSGKTYDDLMQEESAKKLLAHFGNDESGDVRAGLGLYFCPPDPTVSLSEEESLRFEPNFSRRMERVTFPNNTTSTRASLRAVIASLEYVKWASEGITKLVIGTSADWLIRGIVYDIHEWRLNDWTMSKQSHLGLPGEQVPDQDLWELLDSLIISWEKTDCSVRFWHLAENGVDMKHVEKLARLGACKDDQQPAMVKWTKKVKQFA